MMPEHEPSWLERLLAPIMGPALWILVLIIAFEGLTGCQTINEADSDIARKSILAKQRQEELAAAQRGEVIFDPTPYYGSEVIAETGSKNGKALPKSVEGARGIELNLGGLVGIGEIAAAISNATDIPVQVRSSYGVPTGEDGSEIASVRVPIPGKMRITYSGALSKLLDRVGARMDVAWSYDGTAITFDRMVTKRYRLAIPNDASSYSTTIGGLKSSGSNNSVNLTKTSDFDPWAELMGSLSGILAEPAYAQISKSTGRVTVFAPPLMQKQVQEVIHDYQAIYSTRIGLEIGVFFVDVDKVDDFGVGLRHTGSEISLTGAAGALTGNGVATLSNGSTQIDFKALASHEAVVDHRVRSVIAQSGVVSPIVLTRTQNYVSGSETETTETGSTTSVTVGTVDTGISIHAVPRLISEREIQLSLTLMLNNLTALDTFGEGSNSVQLPVVDQRAIQNDTVLAPGETLVFSAYEQTISRRSQSGVGLSNFLGLGGSNKGETSRVRMVLLVRPALIGRRG